MAHKCRREVFVGRKSVAPSAASTSRPADNATLIRPTRATLAEAGKGNVAFWTNNEAVDAERVIQQLCGDEAKIKQL